MKEEKIIADLKVGSIEALEKLYALYAEGGLKTAYLITSDKYMAEDILQETFIQCYKHINSLRDSSAFKPWFYKILTRLALKEIKKSKRLTPIENIFERADTSVSDTYFSSYKDSYLFNYIEALKPKQKAVIIHFYYNEMSIKEIAKTLGCREGTVKSRLNSARNNLKKAIENEVDI